MPAGLKILDTQIKSLTLEILQNLDDHYTDFWTCKIVKPKQVICRPNFVTERKRRFYNLKYFINKVEARG